MSHQGTKTPGHGRWANGQMGRIAKTLPPARPPLHPTSCLPAHLPICLLLALLVASPAVAQVAAHAPVVIQPPSNSSVTLRPVGRPVVRVNGAVLTDRDLLREMFTIFPYARIHNGFPREMEAGIRDGAMKMIIFEELVYQEAKRRNMTVPPGRARARPGGVSAAVQFLQRISAVPASRIPWFGTDPAGED